MFHQKTIIGKNLRKMSQLLLMFCMLKKKKIYPVYVSKNILNREKQVILLLTVNGKGWRYLAEKKYQHY